MHSSLDARPPPIDPIARSNRAIRLRLLLARQRRCQGCGARRSSAHISAWARRPSTHTRQQARLKSSACEALIDLIPTTHLMIGGALVVADCYRGRGCRCRRAAAERGAKVSRRVFCLGKHSTCISKCRHPHCISLDPLRRHMHAGQPALGQSRQPAGSSSTMVITDFEVTYGEALAPAVRMHVL